MARSVSILCRCLLLVLACVSIVRADKKTTQELRERADAASSAQCARLCMDAAKRLVDESSQQITAGDTTAGLKTLEDALKYAENGAQGSLSTHRRLKDTEIDLREVIRRLDSIKQSLEADQRPLIDQRITRLEQLRDQLLATMFGNPKKTLEHK